MKTSLKFLVILFLTALMQQARSQSLSYSYLRAYELLNQNLSGIVFNASSFSDYTFLQNNFSGSDLSGSIFNISGTNYTFLQNNFTGANLTNSIFNVSGINYAFLQNNFTNANLTGSTFNVSGGYSFFQNNFSGANLEGVTYILNGSFVNFQNVYNTTSNSTSSAPPSLPEATQITWGSAQNITDDSDVSTLGSLLYAYNIGKSDVSTPSAVAATTVNGVLFNAFAFLENYTSNTTTLGDLTFTESPGQLWAWNDLSHNSGGFADLSAGYQSLLASGGSAGAAGTITVTLGGLTVGQDYLVQWWSNDSAWFSGGSAFSQTSASGDPSSVTLDSNNSDTPGALGQYVIGTFTAISPFAEFDLNGIGGLPLINAIQVRNITSAAVPEPGQVAASLVLLAGIGGYVWLKRRKAAKAATA